MGEVTLSRAVSTKLTEVQQYYQERSPEAAERALTALLQSYGKLRDNPYIGRPWRDSLTRRALATAFGSGGFVSLYEIEPDANSVVVLYLRYQSEEKYKIIEN
jgi:plasmid stabilization system protein ParE